MRSRRVVHIVSLFRCNWILYTHFTTLFIADRLILNFFHTMIGMTVLLQQAKADVADLERQLASARKQLEEETLAKVELENRVQSLKVSEHFIFLQS